MGHTQRGLRISYNNLILSTRFYLDTVQLTRSASSLLSPGLSTLHGLCEGISSIKTNYHLNFSTNNTAKSNYGDGEGKLPNDATQMRLSKFLASTGLCSRREAETWIISGRIQVDGAICKDVCKIVQIDGNDKSLVMVDGTKVVKDRPMTAPKLWAAYKMRGELTSSQDKNKLRKLFLDRVEALLGKQLSKDHKLSTDQSYNSVLKPINRLDFNTEGLCLVSNNGVLARMLGSSKNLKKEYRVRIHGLLTESKIEGLRRGVFTDGRRQQPMDVVIENSSSTISWLKISTTECSNRTVYNCLRQLHLDVTRMICVGYGPYNISNMPPTGIFELKLTPELSKEFLYLKKKQV